MKTFKKLSAFLLSAILAACLCGVAACGKSPDDPEKEKTYYTVTTTYNAEEGKIELSPAATDSKYEANTSVTATVTAEEGFEVATFTVDGTAKELSEAGTYTFTVTANTTLAATFTETQEDKTYYTVTTTYNAEEGKIELSPAATDNKYEANTSVTATVTAEEGFEVATFTVDGTAKELSEAGTYTFTVTANTTLAATFEETEPTPVPATLPETWRGTYYRATGTTVIVIDEAGLKIDDAVCPVTKVGDVYHTEWNGDDYILSLNDGSFSYGVLRLTKTADNGLTEINFYESDLSGTIDADVQGTWVDKTHDVTLVLGEKTVSWNGEELTVRTIGTNNNGEVDLYVLYEDHLINIYMQFGKLHCYVGNVEHTFEKDESGSEVNIPEKFHGTFKGTLEDDTEVTLTVDGSTITLNGEAGTFISVGTFNADDILTFSTETYGKCEFYVHGGNLAGQFSLYTNDENHYTMTFTKQAEEVKDFIPEKFHGTFTGELEDGTAVTLKIDGSTVTLNNEAGTNIRVGDPQSMYEILTFDTATYGKCEFYVYTGTLAGDLSLSTDGGNHYTMTFTKQA